MDPGARLVHVPDLHDEQNGPLHSSDVTFWFGCACLEPVEEKA